MEAASLRVTPLLPHPLATRAAAFGAACPRDRSSSNGAAVLVTTKITANSSVRRLSSSLQLYSPFLKEVLRSGDLH